MILTTKDLPSERGNSLINYRLVMIGYHFAWGDRVDTVIYINIDHAPTCPHAYHEFKIYYN